MDKLLTLDCEYFIYCDGDDFFTDEEKLQKQVDFLDENKECSMCFHPVKMFWEDGSRDDMIYAE